MIGRTIGSYTIVDKLGAGGMGEVYLAEHRRIARRAAIKFLLPSLSRDSDVVARFFNEARATSVIKHPGIVEIFDCDVIDDRAYIVMEYLEGESLAGALNRVGSFAGEIASVASVGGQIASALSAAHAKGIIHRDLKPENVFLAMQVETGVDGNFTVKILDFGIAKLAGDSAVGGGGSNTRTGSVLGTPVYMSPEQCRGLSTVDFRADIYALGCIMFEMLTGRHVFVKEAPGDLLVAHIHEPAPRVSSLLPTVPPVLDDLIARMLAKNPADRPSSMAAVVSELEDLLGTKAVEFARKIPLTSTMIGGVSLRPRVALPSPLPDVSTPRPPARVPRQDDIVTQPRVPSGVAGGTKVLSQTAAASSSTFRHTASELLPAPSLRPSKTPWVVAIGVVGAGVAGAIFLFGQPHGDGRRGGETAVVTPAASGEARTPPRRAVEAPEEPAEAQAPVRPARRPVRIESTPADAELWIDGEPRPRGRTPLDVALPTGSRPVDAVLKAPGYADRAISLDPARDRPLVVELAKEVSAKPIKEKPSKETPSKETASKRHSSHESRSKPPPPAGERPTAKPEQPGYFGVGD